MFFCPSARGVPKPVSYTHLDVYKRQEEVRRLATALSLPDSIALRPPFPASGLALRIFGQVTPERRTVLRAADACFSEEIREGGYAKRLWQYLSLIHI